MNLLLMIWNRLNHTAARTAEALNGIAKTQKLQAEAIQENNKKLDQIIDLLTTGPLDHFEFAVRIEGAPTTQEGALTMNLTDSQRAQLSIRPVDRKGKPAPLDGVPVWATSDETVATVTVGAIDTDGNVVADETGLRAVLEGVAPGTCRITVTGDANMSPDTTAPITGVLEVTVTAGQAINVAIDASSPVELP
jgi:hypothetical protein